MTRFQTDPPPNSRRFGLLLISALAVWPACGNSLSPDHRVPDVSGDYDGSRLVGNRVFFGWELRVAQFGSSISVIGCATQQVSRGEDVQIVAPPQEVGSGFYPFISFSLRGSGFSGEFLENGILVAHDAVGDVSFTPISANGHKPACLPPK